MLKYPLKGCWCLLALYSLDVTFVRLRLLGELFCRFCHCCRNFTGCILAGIRGRSLGWLAPDRAWCRLLRDRILYRICVCCIKLGFRDIFRSRDLLIWKSFGLGRVTFFRNFILIRYFHHFEFRLLDSQFLNFALIF